jgi:ABC-type antimicrobial peptide transport system permease subunit
MSTGREQLLLPLAQHPDVRRDAVPVNDDRGGAPRLMLVARSAAGEPPMKLTAALENAIREHDPAFDRASIVTGVSLRRSSMDDFLDQSALAGITGGVALLLAALGIYGVVGLMVSTRTREIAVRVTLGASRRRVIGMILLDVVKLVAPGVAVGVLLTAAIVRLEGGIAVSNIEPLAYVAGAAIAIVTAVLASLAPARRAASVQPMVAMRST